MAGVAEGTFSVAFLRIMSIGVGGDEESANLLLTSKVHTISTYILIQQTVSSPTCTAGKQLLSAGERLCVARQTFRHTSTLQAFGLVSMVRTQVFRRRNAEDRWSAVVTCSR